MPNVEFTPMVLRDMMARIEALEAKAKQEAERIDVLEIAAMRTADAVNQLVRRAAREND